MNRPIRIVDGLIMLVKALLIAGAIIWLGRYFGLHVREAGGSATSLGASNGSSANQIIESRPSASFSDVSRQCGLIRRQLR